MDLIFGFEKFPTLKRKKNIRAWLDEKKNYSIAQDSNWIDILLLLKVLVVYSLIFGLTVD